MTKMDQEGHGRWIGIPFGTNEATCPVHAVREWVQVPGITTGAAFRGLTQESKHALERISAIVDSCFPVFVRNERKERCYDSAPLKHTLRIPYWRIYYSAASFPYASNDSLWSEDMSDARYYSV